MAAETLDGLSKDRKAQVTYISRVMHEMDREADIKHATNKGLVEGHQNGLMEGHQKGLVEGRREGRREGLREAAEKLLRSNQSIEFVAAVTELPIAHVQEIAKQIQEKK